MTDKEWITDEDLPLEYHFAQARRRRRRPRHALPGGVRHVRAQLHPPRAREERLERHGDGAVLSGLPLSTLKFKMSRLEIRGDIARKIAAVMKAKARLTRTPGLRCTPYVSERLGRPSCSYFFGRTASFSCLAIRALTTVFAGILIASPVAGLRPIRAFRF